jgi:hypothetical protein
MSPGIERVEPVTAPRRNAQKSTGPKTPAGRAASKMNVLKHGILSREAVVRGRCIKEDDQEFAALHQRLYDDLNPVGLLEEMLVDQIATAHWLWFITKCSKLGEQFRYSPESVFDTFPWPQIDVSPSAARRDIFVEPPAKNRPSSVGATSSEYAPPDGAKSTTAGYKYSAPDGAALPKDAIAKIDAVASAARELRRVRAETFPKIKGGLRALYRTLELPGANPLKDAHAALDAAVLAAYGFSAKKDLLAQLLALNQEVAAKIAQGAPVTAPGVPPHYPAATNLVTEDCIKPSQP